MGKVKLENPEFDKLFQNTFFRSIRNKTLQKLILLYVNYRGHVSDASEIKAKDVMDLLKCSKRTAYDYIHTLEHIWI